MKKVTKSKQRLFAQLNLAQKLNFSLISKKSLFLSLQIYTYHATEHFIKPKLIHDVYLSYSGLPSILNPTLWICRNIILHQELNLYLKFRVIFTYPNERKHFKSDITNECKFNSNQYVICWKYLVLFQRYPLSISKRSQ